MRYSGKHGALGHTTRRYKIGVATHVSIQRLDKPFILLLLTFRRVAFDILPYGQKTTTMRPKTL